MDSTKLIIQLCTIAISGSLQMVSLVATAQFSICTPSPPSPFLSPLSLLSLLSPLSPLSLLSFLSLLSLLTLILSLCAGSVMYQTSPEEPGGIVGKLCHKHSSESVLLGCYTIQGSTVGDRLNWQHPTLSV